MLAHAQQTGAQPRMRALYAAKRQQPVLTAVRGFGMLLDGGSGDERAVRRTLMRQHSNRPTAERQRDLQVLAPVFIALPHPQCVCHANASAAKAAGCLARPQLEAAAFFAPRC